MKDTFAIVYAGHGNQLLGDLIAHRCVAALPLGGRFRAIDLVLSNISASGIKNVGVITERNHQSLVEHIGSGDAWDLASKKGGIALLQPFDQGISTDLYHGFVDALVRQELEKDSAYDYVLACGPKPMLRNVAKVAEEFGVKCLVSMEERMGCGIGACLVCACDMADGSRKHVCKDGPVFDSKEVDWNA